MSLFGRHSGGTLLADAQVLGSSERISMRMQGDKVIVKQTGSDKEYVTKDMEEAEKFFKKSAKSGTINWH